MNIPNFVDSQVIDDSGNLTPIWKQVFMQLFSALQINLGPEGFFLPQQDDTNIVILNNIKSLGSIIYNTTTNKAMINENGSFKTIQTL
jgi:hypothetical protein